MNKISIFFATLLILLSTHSFASSPLEERLQNSNSPALRALLRQNIKEGSHSRIQNFEALYSSQGAALSPQSSRKLSAVSGATEAFENSRDFLLELAREKGYWDGRSHGSITDSADYVLLAHYMGWENPERVHGIISEMKTMQNPDGSFDLSPGYERGRFDATAHVVLAMELGGVSEQDPVLSKARDYLKTQPRLKELRTMTRLWYCLNGKVSWSTFPPVPREIYAISFVRKLNQKHVSSWMRFAFHAMSMIIRDAQEKAHHDREGLSRVLSGLGRLIRKGLFGSLDKKAIAHIEKYLLEQQGEDGNFFGIVSHTMYGVMALKALGYDLDSEQIQKGMEFIENLQVQTENGWVQDPYRGPIWDTAFTLNAMAEAGVSPDHEVIAKARKFLLDKQIVDVYGEWAKKGEIIAPGGWAFELENDLYPDNDDTAMAILAIMKNKSKADAVQAEEALVRGIKWLEFMQNSDGSWAAWDKDQATKPHGPFQVPDRGFFKDSIRDDFGTADLTGHVLEAFGSVGFTHDYPAVSKAIDYLRREQMDFGGFWGRWGINYIYGTHGALCGLKEVGVPAEDPMVQKAISWLKSVQNEDGGFGETMESYYDTGQAGIGPSMPTQTGWALVGLLAYLPADDETVQKAIQYLVETQRQDGGWDEPVYIGVGMPPILYTYEYSPYYMPFAALARYQEKLKEHH